MSASGVSVADMIKKDYKQIPADKCVAGGGKHVNLVMDPTVGYCLCPEGQSIVDAANPKCAPIDAKTTYDPFSSGFYREGTECKKDEGLVTQKHPWHQNFGEAACISPAPVCLPGFEKQQLRYDGEVLDYCVRKDEKGNFVSSYYPTTFLIRPAEPVVVPAPVPVKETGVPKWVWYVVGSVVAIVLIVIFAFVGYKLLNREPAAAPVVAAPVFASMPEAPTQTTSFSAPANDMPPKIGGKAKIGTSKLGRGRGRK